jgi:hypothetical protein
MDTEQILRCSFIGVLGHCVSRGFRISMAGENGGPRLIINSRGAGDGLSFGVYGI